MFTTKFNASDVSIVTLGPTQYWKFWVAIIESCVTLGEFLQTEGIYNITMKNWTQTLEGNSTASKNCILIKISQIYKKAHFSFWVSH